MTGQQLARMPWQDDPTFQNGDFGAVGGPKIGAEGADSGRYPALRGQSPHSQEEQWRFEPANLPPKPVPLSASEYVKGLEMPGEGKHGPACGTVVGVRACPSVAEPIKSAQTPLPGGKAHTVAVTPFYCKSPRCPKCWPVWLERAAQRGAERLDAAQALYALREPRHFTFSPPQAKTCQALRKKGVGAMSGLYRTAYKVIRQAGLSGGLVVFHPWRCSGKGVDRYRTSRRHLAPHFHVLGFGYVENTLKFTKNFPGWIVKNLDARKCGRCGSGIRAGAFRCKRCGFKTGCPPPPRVRLRYLLDHCGLNVSGDRAKDAVRAFGEVHALRVVERRRIEHEIKCPCGTQCWDYESPHGDDTPGAPLQPAVDVMICTVYARRKGAKAPPGAPEFYYSISSEGPPPDPGRQTSIEAHT